jgi:hypothetical protein
MLALPVISESPEGLSPFSLSFPVGSPRSICVVRPQPGLTPSHLQQSKIFIKIAYNIYYDKDDLQNKKIQSITLITLTPILLIIQVLQNALKE